MIHHLRKPFEAYSEKKLFYYGIISLIAGVLLSTILDTRFDGVIDVHFSREVSWSTAAIDMGINVLSMTLLLFFLAKSLNTKTRFIDILNTSLISRIPLYPLAIFNIGHLMTESGERLLGQIQENPGGVPQITDIFLLIIFAFFALAALVFSILIHYQGFSVASNAKGSKAVVLFTITFILAEILSKILISWLI